MIFFIFKIILETLFSFEMPKACPRIQHNKSFKKADNRNDIFIVNDLWKMKSREIFFFSIEEKWHFFSLKIVQKLFIFVFQQMPSCSSSSSCMYWRQMDFLWFLSVSSSMSLYFCAKIMHHLASYKTHQSELLVT